MQSAVNPTGLYTEQQRIAHMQQRVCQGDTCASARSLSMRIGVATHMHAQWAPSHLTFPQHVHLCAHVNASNAQHCPQLRKATLHSHRTAPHQVTTPEGQRLRKQPILPTVLLIIETRPCMCTQSSCSMPTAAHPPPMHACRPLRKPKRTLRPRQTDQRQASDTHRFDCVCELCDDLHRLVGQLT